MNPTPESEFEQRLRRQPIRPIPAEWRDVILQEACRQSGMGVAPVSPSHSFTPERGTAVPAVASLAVPEAQAFARRRDRRDACATLDLRRWFSFARLGWTGLAAAWVLILALDHAARPEPLNDLVGKPPAASEAWAAWAQNQRELARLLDRPPAFPPLQPVRQPRQQSRLPLSMPLA